MNRGVAANRVLVSAEEILNDAVVILDDDGIVVSFNLLSDLPSEPANTYFFTGVIAPVCVDIKNICFSSISELEHWLTGNLKKQFVSITPNKKVNLYLYTLSADGSVETRALT